MTVFCPLAMFYICWQLAVVCFGGLILLVFFNLVSTRILQKRFYRSHDYKEKLTSIVQESFQTAQSVFNTNANEFDKYNEKLFRSDEIGSNVWYGLSRFIHQGAVFGYRIGIALYTGLLYENSLNHHYESG
jgi:ABC-type multidrug transport system fused ATPase/permease subunit